MCFNALNYQYKSEVVGIWCCYYNFNTDCHTVTYTPCFTAYSNQICNPKRTGDEVEKIHPIALWSKAVNLLWRRGTTNWTFDRKNVAPEKQEEATQTHFNVVFLIFWGCRNNYLADVVSMAAITPGKRALHYQWEQQSVLCLCLGDNTPTPNSVKQPSGFLSNGKDSQIKSSMFCRPVTGCHTGELGSPSKANTGTDRVVYSALHFVWWPHVLFWLRDHLLSVRVNH